MYMYIYMYIYIYLYILIYIYKLPFQTENGKWKASRFSSIRLLIVQTEVIRLQMD
jgi:hypothetical protein